MKNRRKKYKDVWGILFVCCQIDKTFCASSYIIKSIDTVLILFIILKLV